MGATPRCGAGTVGRDGTRAHKRNAATPTPAVVVAGRELLLIEALKAHMDQGRNKESSRVKLSAAIKPVLTARELQVLRSLADGRTDQQIAGLLALSHKTIGHHVGRIMVKLDANNRAHAVAIAVRRSLITLD